MLMMVAGIGHLGCVAGLGVVFARLPAPSRGDSGPLV